MADQNYEPGTQVQLKSGGPVMTVVKRGNYDGAEQYLCRWYDQKTNGFKEQVFVPATIKRVD